ncbi:MAG TPA: hypothetical protein DCK98_10440 [Chloroflexi bacterium]|jgi:hypothetical protein|nr:hypothetical protein [Chloroflexota bacterium]HAL26244.1 hypothetical protein [Chloroflexota bacterium]
MAQRKPSPLISSVNALRGLAAGITMLSLAGMTVYAGGHLRNDAAPLQPAAAAAAATTAPAAATTTTSSTGRLQLSRTVTTTTRARSVTTTHHS